MNNQTKHTPGPWVCGTKGFSFPDLRSWQVAPFGTRTDAISQADLNLIAAAPDLYEACQAAFLLLSEYAPIWAVKVEDQLREALAKARG